MRLLRPLLALAAAALGFCSAAQAGYATIAGFDLNSASDTDTTPLTATPNSNAAATTFLSTIYRNGREDFESQALGGASNRTLTFAGDGPQLTATLNSLGAPEVWQVSPGSNAACNLGNFVSTGRTDCAGRYSVLSPNAPSGAANSNFLLVDAGTGFEIRFNQAIAAFGFNGIDVGDFDGSVKVELLGSNFTTVLDSKLVVNGAGPSNNGSVLFFGLTSTAIDSDFYGVRFITSQGQSTNLTVDTIGFDNFTIVERSQLSSLPPDPDDHNIPEPGTMLLLGAAMAAMGAFARKRAR